MSADTPTPLDLDAIRAMLGDRLAVTTRSVALDLLAEVERLRAEVAELRERIDVDRAMHEAFRPEVVAEVAVLVCDEMDWQAVADWCGGTIGSAQDPSGEYTSSIAIPGVGEAYQGMWIVQRHDLTFAIRVTLDGPSAESVARLTASRAPARDEEVVVEVIAATLAAHPWSAMLGGCAPRSGCDWQGEHAEDEQERHAAHVAGLVAAVVRELLPVKPDREAVARAIVPTLDEWWCGDHVDYRATDDEGGALPCCVAERQRQAQRQADAVLDLWPGRSEAEVKAEALREFADAHRFPSDWIMFRRDDGTGVTVSDMLREVAARLAAEGGAS